MNNLIAQLGLTIDKSVLQLAHQAISCFPGGRMHVLEGPGPYRVSLETVMAEILNSECSTLRLQHQHL